MSPIRRPAPGKDWLDESKLLARLRSGKEDALETFCERFAVPLFSFSRQLTGDEETAGALVETVFRRGLERSGTRADTVSLTAWLCSMALLEWHRRRQQKEPKRRNQRNRRPAVPATAPGPAVSWSDLAADDDSQRPLLLSRLGEQARRLPIPLWIPWVMVDVEGMSYDLAGEVLDLSVGMIKSRVHQARLRLLEPA